jgi:hypothetical protein
MEIAWAPYADVSSRWPRQGRHILASYDQDEIVVYQAYRPEIADVAVAQKRFASPFSLQRMSWIKPNFLWMMYRCGWATKPDQQRVLAIHLPRVAFYQILAQAVWSSFQPDLHPSSEVWSAAIQSSDVRLQWDPDHDPTGKPLERRAIQLGLRGKTLEQYATMWPVRIEDITTMVQSQHQRISEPHELLIPDERPVPIADTVVRQHLKLDQP